MNNKISRTLLVLLLPLLFSSCLSNSAENEIVETNQGDDTTQVDNDTTEEDLPVLEGTLIYKEIPPSKNVRAWTGHEFFLYFDYTDEYEVLQPSDEVTREDLLSYHDQKVRVYGFYIDPEYIDPADLDPMVSYPTDMDGNPLPKGGGYQVVKIELMDDK